MPFLMNASIRKKTAKAMDEEARNTVDAAYERTLNLLLEKKEQVENVAKMLLDKETITHDDMVDLIGDRPFQGDPVYLEFISRRRKSPTSPTEEDPTIADESSDKSEETDEGEDDVSTLQPAPAL